MEPKDEWNINKEDRDSFEDTVAMALAKSKKIPSKKWYHDP